MSVAVSVANPVLSTVTDVRFEGGKKFRGQTPEVTQTLHKAGINRELLADEWGVTLWRAFFKDDRAVVTFDTGKKKKGREVDFKGLSAWVTERLNEAGFKKVRVLERPLKDCCGKSCKSCLHDNKQTRKDWTA